MFKICALILAISLGLGQARAAISLSAAQPSGITVTYFKIENLNFNASNDQLTVTYAAFLSSAYYQAGVTAGYPYNYALPATQTNSTCTISVPSFFSATTSLKIEQWIDNQVIANGSCAFTGGTYVQ